MAKNVQHKMAQSIPPVVGKSTLADMESRTTSAAATAPTPAALKTGASTNFSGQYLFDRFVTNDKTEVTKLGIVRQMVEQLDLERFKSVINDFVKVATGFRDNAIEAAKKEGTYDKDHVSPEIATYEARVKTALNHQTVMRKVYGGLKFAPEALATTGFNNNTGYLVASVMATKALKEAGIKWDGTKTLSKTEAEQKAHSNAESKAFAKVMANTPRNDKETMPQYVARCAPMVEAQLQKDAAEHDAKAVEALVKLVREKAGGYLDEVIEKLLQPATIAVPVTPELEPKSAKAASATATKH